MLVLILTSTQDRHAPNHQLTNFVPTPPAVTWYLAATCKNITRNAEECFLRKIIWLINVLLWQKSLTTLSMLEDFSLSPNHSSNGSFFLVFFRYILHFSIFFVFLVFFVLFTIQPLSPSLSPGDPSSQWVGVRRLIPAMISIQGIRWLWGMFCF